MICLPNSSIAPLALFISLAVYRTFTTNASSHYIVRLNCDQLASVPPYPRGRGVYVVVPPFLFPPSTLSRQTTTNISTSGCARCLDVSFRIAAALMDICDELALKNALLIYTGTRLNLCTIHA